MKTPTVSTLSSRSNHPWINIGTVEHCMGEVLAPLLPMGNFETIGRECSADGSPA